MGYRIWDIEVRYGADSDRYPISDIPYPLSPVIPLPPVDSNHHSRIQSPMSCHWTRGQTCSPSELRKLFLCFDLDNTRRGRCAHHGRTRGEVFEAGQFTLENAENRGS